MWCPLLEGTSPGIKATPAPASKKDLTPSLSLPTCCCSPDSPPALHSKQGKASHYFPLSIVHGVRNQQENDAEGVMPGKALLKTFWNSECLLQNMLHLKLLINCCFADVTAQYALQTTHAVGVGGLFLAFYLSRVPGFKGVPEIATKQF